MKPSFWTIAKRLPRAIRIYFLVGKLYKHCGDKQLRKRVSKGYFKLALAWS